MFQYKMFSLLNDLEEYNPTNVNKIKSKEETLVIAGKLHNNRDKVIKAFENGIFPFNDGFQKKNLSDKTLTDWVKGGKKRFDKIRNKFQNPKNNNLQARPSGKFINFIELNKLIQETAYSKITHEEALERITSIRDDIDKITSQETLTSNQVEVLNTLFMVNEIFTGKIKFIKENSENVLEVFEQESNITRQNSVKQADTTDMLDLEDDESAAQEKQVAKDLKILTPNQMLSRLPISLVQLKAGNNSEKLKNEIRQLLYSLCRSKKLTKKLYKSFIDII